MPCLTFHLLFSLVSTLNGVIIFILFLPGIFVEHDGPGDATDPKLESPQNGPEEVIKGPRRSQVVPIVPREALVLREHRMEAHKPKQFMVPKPDLLACSISVWCFFSFFVAIVLEQT